MIFSAHLVDTNPVQALRRKAPTPGDASGLHSARVAIAAPFTSGPLPRPQLGRESLLACWQDEASLDQFLSDHPTGQVFDQGWHVRMECFRAVGVWPGLGQDIVEAVKDVPAPTEGPSVAITIGTAYLKSVLPFLKVTKGLDRQFLADSSGLWGTALSNVPQRLVASFTVWETPRSAVEYMRTGAHGQAIKDHYDPKKDPTGHTFVTGGGFFGFRPIATRGSIGGTNGVPSDLFAI